VGPIPNDWDVARVKHLSTIYSGGTPDRENRDYWDDGTIPWLNSGEVNQWLITVPSTYITEAGFQNSSAKWIPMHALVMALAGQGKTKGMVAQLGIETTCNQSMAAIVPGQRVHPRFMQWWLHANYETIRNLAGGEQRDGLNLEIVGNIPCPVPSTTTQVAIADYLDRETARLDALVATKELVLALLAEKRRALITRAVTGGLDPDARRRDSGISSLGEIPAHWTTNRLKFIAEISYGVGDELDKSLTSGVPLISLPNVDIEGLLHLDELGWADLNEAEKAPLLLRKGDLLFNWRNGSSAHVGKTAYFDAEGEFTHVGFLLRIRFDQSRYEPRFFQALLQMLRATGYFLYTRAMVNNTFNQTELGNLSVVVPALAEQRAIVAYITTETTKLDAMRASTERTISLLKERRAALVAAAVSGHIEIKPAV
jgi:type I restriction enzyme S subunit